MDKWLKAALRQYQGSCKHSKKNTKWLLSDEEARNLFVGPCHYCGMESSRILEGAAINGIDKLDPDGDYEPENVVSCCKTCNKMKSDLTPLMFYNHIAAICRHLFHPMSIYGGSRSTYRFSAGEPPCTTIAEMAVLSHGTASPPKNGVGQGS